MLKKFCLKVIFLKTFAHSLNGNDWHLLSTPELKTQEDAMQIRGRFMGDPMHEYEQHELRRFGEGDEAQEDDMTISVKEEDRLASVIAKIDEEAMIVPRGSYLRTPAGQVYKNESFSGLSLKDVSFYDIKINENEKKFSRLKN